MPKLSLVCHDSKSLKSICRELESTIADLKELVSKMERGKIEGIHLKYDGEMMRALKYLPRFVAAGNDSVRLKVLEDRVKLQRGNSSAQVLSHEDGDSEEWK